MSTFRLPVALTALTALAPAQDDRDLIGRVPEAWANVVQIRDVVPVVERVLGSPALEEAWKGAAEGLALIEPSVRGVTPRLMLGPFALVKEQVPVEIVFAAPESTLGDIGALYQGVATAFLGWMVVEQGQIEDPALYDFRDAVAASLTTLSAPHAYVAVRARNARVADAWFDAIADGLVALGDWGEHDTADAIDPDDDDGGGLTYLIADEIRARIEVGGFLESGNAGGVDVWARLGEMGLLRAEEEATKRLRAHAASLTVEVRVVVSGDLLEIEIGDVDAARKGGVRGVAGGDPAPFVFSTWNMPEFVERMDALLDLMFALDVESEEYIDGALPGAYEQLLDSAMSAVEQGAIGRASFEIGESAVDVVTWEPFDPEFDWTPPAARDTGITAFVPGPKSWVTATGYLTLDEWLYSDYDGLGWALDDLSLEAWDRGLEALSELTESWSFVMLGDLSDLYEFLGGGDSAVFEDGTLFVLDAEGDGLPACALVGLPFSREDAEQFVDEAAELLLDGLEVDAEAATSKIALRDGPEALVFALPGAPADTDAFESAIFAPHAVVLDGALILSTRARLTRELLAAKAQGGVRAIDAELVTDERSTGAAWASILEAIGRALPEGGREMRQVRGLLDAFAALARLVGDVTITERIEDGGLTTRMRFELRE